MLDPRTQAQSSDLSVSTRLIRLEAGLFGLSLMPGTPERGNGLPAVRVCLPPAPPGRRELVTISTVRGDGWLTVSDEPALLRVPPEGALTGAEVLVTLYWSGSDPAGAAPSLRLMRLNPAANGGGAPSASPLASMIGGAVPAAEIVAHVEGVGDVHGKFGDWVGIRGSGRSIEGFSLAPAQGVSSADFELRAVLGRDWVSPWLPGTSFCGSRGLALPLRGFCIRLRSAAATRLELNCSARFVDGSEVGPVGSDKICASPGLAPLEAFQVVVRPRVT
jgi:hypothetical protein